MSEDRLATELWVAAHLRLGSSQGVPMVVVRRGDRSRGAVLLKLYQPGSGWTVLSQVRREERLCWLRSPASGWTAEAEADAMIARQLRIDPDLWVIEVEDRDGRPWFDGKVLAGP